MNAYTPDAILNTYTGEVWRIHVTPINHDHIVKRDNGVEILHRGTETSAREFLARTVEGYPPRHWVYVVSTERN